MPIAITCPSCKAAYKLADNMRGKKVVCRACKKPIVVTSGGTAKRDEDHEDKVLAKNSRFRDDDVVDAEEVVDAVEAEADEVEGAEDVEEAGEVEEVEIVEAVEEVEEVAEVEEVGQVEEAVEAHMDGYPRAGKKRFRDDEDEPEEVEEAEELDDDSPGSKKKGETAKKRSMAPVLLVGGGVGVIAVAGVVALLVMGGDKPQKSSATSGAGTQVAGGPPNAPPSGPPGAPPSGPPSGPPSMPAGNPPSTPPANPPGAPSSNSPTAPSVPATPPTTPVKEPMPPRVAKAPQKEASKDDKGKGQTAVKVAAAKSQKKRDIRVVPRMNEQEIYERIVKSTVWVKGETKDRLKFSVIALGGKSRAALPEIPGLPKRPGEEDNDPPEEDEEQRKLPPDLTIISPKYRYTGSGSLISRKHRLILTNVHVAGDADSLIFHFPDYDDKGHVIVSKEHYNKKPGIKGELVERVDRADVALVKLESVPDGIPVVPLAKESARPGQRIHSIGSPGASEFLFNFTGGTIRGVTRDKWPVIVPVPGTEFARILAFDCRIVETDATTNPGDSGGPAVDDWGRLVGIVQGGIPSAKKMNRCVDISEIHKIIKKYFKKIGQTWEPETPEIVPAHLASLPQLLEKLHTGVAAVRVKAIRALADLGPDAAEAFGKLFKLQNDADASVRKAARDALARVPPGKSDVSLLCDILKNKAEDSDTRVEAAKFLARLGTAAKSAADVLAEQLRDADPDLKKELFVALLAVGPDAKHVPILRESWKAADPEIRRLAGENLIKLGSKAKPALPVLIGALKSPDAGTRLIAARAIFAIGSDAAEAKPALRAALSDNDRAVTVTAARALVKLGDADPVMPMLIDILKTKTGDVRKQACQALASLGPKVTNKAAVEELISALDEQTVRADAAKALVKIGKFASEIVAGKMRQGKVFSKESRTACLLVLDRINHVSANIYSALQVVEAHDPDPLNQKLAKRVLKKLTGQKGPG